MKKLIFWILLFLSTYLYAQDYAPLLPGTSYYRTATTSYIWPAYLRDSVSTNSGKEYLLHQNMQRIPHPTPGCDIRVSSGWMGRSYSIHGDSLMFHLDSDSSVLFMLTTQKGEGWVSYNDTNYTLMLHHTTDTTKLILGEWDSVKVFTTTVLNKQQEVIPNHFLNGERIELSKRHGFIRIMNLLDMLYENIESFLYTIHDPIYELCGNSTSTEGVKNITTFDIYDMEIGDEFHLLDYSYSNFPNQYTSDTSWIIQRVISKTIFTDSIVYGYTRRIYNKKQVAINGSWLQSVTYDTLFQPVEPYLPIDAEPGETTISENYAQLYVMGIDENEHLFKYNVLGCYLGNTDSCLSLGYDCTLPYYIYYKGLGGPYYEYAYTDEMPFTRSSAHTLRYYKKGNTTWGIPFSPYVGVTEIQQEHVLIKVYPNPANEYIVIEQLHQDKGVLTLLNIQGKTVAQYPVNNGTMTRIPIQDLDQGIYIYSFETVIGDIAKGKIYIIR